MALLLILVLAGLICWLAVVVPATLLVTLDALVQQIDSQRPLRYRRAWGEGPDLATKRFLQALCDSRRRARDEQRPMVRLFAFRQDFRRIIQDKPIRCLLRCREQEGELRRLAIWLLGHCDRHFVNAAWLAR